MARKRRFGRPVDGMLLVNKEAGGTSNAVVQQARHLFFAAKVGHTGALDPLATGILPLCFGEATKFSQFLLNADKVYESEFCFGLTTDTADADGKTLQLCDSQHVTQKQVEVALGAYRGLIEQLPPMYSALKKNGQPLYKLARAGIEIEREPRTVRIHEFELLSFTPGVQAMARFRVRCSKGTYIRSLARDLGRDLGVGAHVASLKRLMTGNFHLRNAVSLATLEAERGERRAEVLDHHLLPVDAAVGHLPALALDENSAFYFHRGQAVVDNEVYRIGREGDTVRVFQADAFLGLGQITDDSKVAPKRLIGVG